MNIDVLRSKIRNVIRDSNDIDNVVRDMDLKDSYLVEWKRRLLQISVAHQENMHDFLFIIGVPDEKDCSS